jgi:hypothetical protein
MEESKWKIGKKDEENCNGEIEADEMDENEKSI